jgi:hypothetical protein
VRSEPRKVFALENLPAWIKAIQLVVTDADEDPETGRPSDAIIWVGKKHRLKVTVNLYALAALVETTRHGGISVVSNSNHAKVFPSVYAKMSFPTTPGHLVSIRRILFGAGKGRITRPIWQEHDYNPENTRTEADGHPQGDSRQIALAHAEQAAHAAGVDVDAFMQNVRDLYAEVDAIRDSK